MHARPPEVHILDHHHVYFSLLAPVIQMSWKTIEIHRIEMRSVRRASKC